MTGETDSTNFPTTAGAFDTTFNGGTDAFVTKLNADRLGPRLLDLPRADAARRLRPRRSPSTRAGSAYVTGSHRLDQLPDHGRAFDTSLNGGSDAFVTKLSCRPGRAGDAHARARGRHQRRRAPSTA